jgi:hypothetical protein
MTIGQGMTGRRVTWLALYVGSIVLANAMTARLGLVPIGLGLLVTAGTFAAGGALVLRDAVQRTSAQWVLLASIAVGAAVSAATSSPALALASGLAFLVSELVDTAVFTPLRGRLALAVVASSVVSAPVDTVLFLHLAGFPVTWPAVLGQFLVKTAIALAVAAWITWKERRHAVPIGR